MSLSAAAPHPPKGSGSVSVAPPAVLRATSSFRDPPAPLTVHGLMTTLMKGTTIHLSPSPLGSPRHHHKLSRSSSEASTAALSSADLFASCTPQRPSTAASLIQSSCKSFPVAATSTTVTTAFAPDDAHMERFDARQHRIAVLTKLHRIARKLSLDLPMEEGKARTALEKEWSRHCAHVERQWEKAWYHMTKRRREAAVVKLQETIASRRSECFRQVIAPSAIADGPTVEAPQSSVNDSFVSACSSRGTGSAPETPLAIPHTPTPPSHRYVTKSPSTPPVARSSHVKRSKNMSTTAADRGTPRGKPLTHATAVVGGGPSPSPLDAAVLSQVAAVDPPAVAGLSAGAAPASDDSPILVGRLYRKSLMGLNALRESEPTKAHVEEPQHAEPVGARNESPTQGMGTKGGYPMEFGPTHESRFEFT